MRPLSPPLKVIEDNLFMPSISLLIRWVNNDPSLSQETLKALKNNAEAKKLATDLIKQESPVLKEDEEIEEAPPLPTFLRELVKQKIAARERYASFQVPTPGQILRLDHIIGADGKVFQDLSNPLAVLIDKKVQLKNSWQGWMVSPETDYAGYWDMLLEPEDQPFDPLAGMIQVWNAVSVNIPSNAPVLAVLKPARLQAVRALVEEFSMAPPLDISTSYPGHIAPRTTVGNFSILTGTPLGDSETDPRYHYKNLYLRVAKQLQDAVCLEAQIQVNLSQWRKNNFAQAIKAGWLTLEEIIGTRKFEFAYRSPKRAKKIDLGGDDILILETNMEEQANQEIKITLRLFSIHYKDYLPSQLKFSVIPMEGEPLEVVAGHRHDCLEQEWFFNVGEQFRVKIELEPVSFTEEFVI